MACQLLELRAEIRAMQQQLKEKDEEIERGKREIDRCKREIASCKRSASEAAAEAKRSASEAAAEAQNAHTAELAQYLEEKKSLDDFKRLVEKQRSWPWIIRRCFPMFSHILSFLVGWPMASQNRLSLGCSGHRSVMPWRLRVCDNLNATFEGQ